MPLPTCWQTIHPIHINYQSIDINLSLALSLSKIVLENQRVEPRNLFKKCLNEYASFCFGPHSVFGPKATMIMV